MSKPATHVMQAVCFAKVTALSDVSLLFVDLSVH